MLERNQQVKHIGEIYGKSSRVVVWLGESTLQSDITLKYLDKMYYAYGAYNTDKDGQVLHLIRQFEGVLPVVERQNLCWRFLVESKVHAVPNIPTLDSLLHDLFSRTWFNRLW